MIAYGSTLAFVNYFSLPIATHICSKPKRKYIENRRVQQACRTDSYLEDIVANMDVKNCNALTLVKAAHALTAKYLTYDFSENSEGIKEIEKALRDGRGDCSCYSLFTYNNFLYLADRFGRQELKGDVRLCAGMVDDTGHAWLQVCFNDKWENYETTLDMFERDTDINFWNLNMEFSNNVFLRNGNYHSFNYTKFGDGKFADHINYFASIKSGVGCVSALIAFLKDR